MANILKERVNIQNYLNKLKKWSEKKNPNGIQQVQMYCTQARIINYMIIQWWKIGWQQFWRGIYKCNGGSQAVGQEHYVVTKKGGMILKSPEMNIACTK